MGASEVISAARKGHHMKLTTKLKLFKTTGRVKSPPNQVAFTMTDLRPQKLLFFFPVEREMFIRSMHVLRRLERFPAKKNVELAIRSDHREIIPPSKHPTFYYPMTTEHPDRIDYEILANNYSYRSFDAVINLAPEINIELARVMSLIEAPKRIGLEGPGADDLYNIQIRSRSTTDLTAAYDQILAICDLGIASDHPDYHLWG